MRRALLVPMAGGLAFAFGLVGGVYLLSAAQGCTSNETTCSSLQASNYDPSCKVDSDCVVVQELGFCCPNAAINVGAQARYTADVDKAPAACAKKGCNVSCPTTGAPCCRQGTCQLGPSECSAAVPAEDAAAESGADADGPTACVAAGGECLVGGSISVCAAVGPQDCNPDRGPGGSYCCLRKAGVAGAATDSGPLDGGGE